MKEQTIKFSNSPAAESFGGERSKNSRKQ